MYKIKSMQLIISGKDIYDIHYAGNKIFCVKCKQKKKRLDMTGFYKTMQGIQMEDL